MLVRKKRIEWGTTVRRWPTRFAPAIGAGIKQGRSKLTQPSFADTPHRLAIPVDTAPQFRTGRGNQRPRNRGLLNHCAAMSGAQAVLRGYSPGSVLRRRCRASLSTAARSLTPSVRAGGMEAGRLGGVMGTTRE
ncbi:MAG TPA: hypothetical protein VIM34_09640, partial [Burkholderiaceae bacterium]